MKKFLAISLWGICCLLAVGFLCDCGTKTAAGREPVVIGLAWRADYPDGEIDEDTEVFIEAVEKAGAKALLLPKVTNREEARAALAEVDGVIIMGGATKHHELVEEASTVRETSDTCMIEEALAEDLPLLAVCRGMQMLNKALGGTLLPDIPSCIGTAVLHRDPEGITFAEHTVRITDPESLAARALDGAETASVYSWHHEAVDQVGTGLKITAVAADGVPEAIEYPGKRFVLGLQYHPEWMLHDGSAEALNCFSMLVQAAAR